METSLLYQMKSSNLVRCGSLYFFYLEIVLYWYFIPLLLCCLSLAIFEMLMCYIYKLIWCFLKGNSMAVIYLESVMRKSVLYRISKSSFCVGTFARVFYYRLISLVVLHMIYTCGINIYVCINTREESVLLICGERGRLDCGLSDPASRLFCKSRYIRVRVGDSSFCRFAALQ